MLVQKVFNNEVFDQDLDIAEAFGLSDGFDTEVSAEIPDGCDVMLITGESGSGKSVIARSIGITDVPGFDRSTPIADTVNLGHDESLRWLSSFGLGDAKLFTLPYDALSDSQQARFRAMLACLSVPKGETVVIDEFLSTLDRSTARFVALSIRRAVVRSGMRLVAVTAMDDIEPWLMPNATVRGRAFPCRFETRCHKEWGDPLEGISFWYGTKNDYRSCPLGNLHYRGKYTGGAKEYLFASFDGEPIAVLLATNRIGDSGRRIARLIVHPKARGCGVGSRTVRKYLEDFPDTDVVAAMARFSGVFEAAGMERAGDSVQRPPAGLLKSLVGFDSARWHSLEYCTNFMGSRDARSALSRFSKHCTKLIQPGGRHLTTDEIARYVREDVRTAGRVLWWLRPRRYAKYVHKSE